MPESKKKIILLVDDDDFLRNIYLNKLTSEGFEVMPAKDGQEAWELLNAGNIPHLIFTGINMPEMDGFELISKIKSQPLYANILIAISSHRGLPEDKKKAQDLGVNDFIVQSETPPNEVTRRIKLILGMRDVMKITFSPEHYDGKALIDLLNKQQGTYIGQYLDRELILELQAGKEERTFKVKLVER